MLLCCRRQPSRQHAFLTNTLHKHLASKRSVWRPTSSCSPCSSFGHWLLPGSLFHCCSVPCGCCAACWTTTKQTTQPADADNVEQLHMQGTAAAGSTSAAGVCTAAAAAGSAFTLRERGGVTRFKVPTPAQLGWQCYGFEFDVGLSREANQMPC